MADTKITALTAITTVDPAADVLPIVDVSDTSMAASGTTKKITSNQILGAGGTATLASATITGDLTVDTSTLKVDSANNRVGIGTATPDSLLQMAGAGTINWKLSNTSDSVTVGAYAGTTTGTTGTVSNHPFFLFTNNTERYRIASDGVATWSNVGGVAGTAMTLNSTGLGVGVASPTQKLHVKGVVNFEQVSGGTNGWQVYTYTDGTYRMNYNGAGADELIIDSSGNLGVGVTPSAWAAGYKAIQIAASQSTALMGSGNQTELTTNAFFDGAWKYQGAGTVAASRYSQQSGVHYWYTAAAGAAGTAIGSGFANAAMTLDASGRLLVGSTSNPAYDGFRGFFYNNGNNTLISQCDSANYCLLLYTGNGTNVGSAAAFKYGSTTVGTIQTTASSTAYNTSSDYRLKESVQAMTGALNRIAALKPSTYKWKVDGSSGEGFIAHELAQVVPLAVTGEKDAVNEDGSIKAQGVDLSKVVPVLVAAIQELTARVQTLETR